MHSNWIDTKNHHFWVVFKFVVGFSEAQSSWDRILFTDLQVSFNSWIIYNLLPLERTHRDLTNIYIYTFVYNIYIYISLFVLWCLMPLSTIFQLYRGVSFVGGGPGENYPPVASHWQTLSHNVVHLTMIEIRTHNISGDSH